MRFKVSVCMFTAALFFAAPAFAGGITYADGQGSWTPSSCQKPQAPAPVAHNPEASADYLNARFMEHRQYVIDAQNYMNCLSSESQKDALAASQIIIRTAEEEINRVNVEAAKMAEQMEKLRAQLAAKGVK